MMLFVFAYLPPEDVLYTIRTSVVVFAVNISYFERKYYSTRLGSAFGFVPPWFTYIIPLMAITDITEPQAGVRPPLQRPLCSIYPPTQVIPV